MKEDNFMVDEQERDKVIRYQVLQQRAKVLDSRRNLILNRLIEVNNTLASLDELKNQNDNNIFIPLGSGVYVKGSLEDADKMIILIGSDVAVDVNFDKSKNILEDNRRVLNDGLKTIENDMMKTAEELVELEFDIQRIMQKQN